jgi:large subunit ribosomal protein L13
MSKLTKITTPVRIKDIDRKWHLIDLKNKILGRAVSEIAILLQGKNKRDYVPYIDCGDYVVVINAGKVKISGKKIFSKTYSRYSGFPGGLKIKKYNELIQQNPNYIVKHAVSGMLPKNKLSKKRLLRLFVFNGEKHDFEDKFLNK